MKTAIIDAVVVSFVVDLKLPIIIFNLTSSVNFTAAAMQVSNIVLSGRLSFISIFPISYHNKTRSRRLIKIGAEGSLHD